DHAEKAVAPARRALRRRLRGRPRRRVSPGPLAVGRGEGAFGRRGRPRRGQGERRHRPDRAGRPLRDPDRLRRWARYGPLHLAYTVRAGPEPRAELGPVSRATRKGGQGPGPAVIGSER